MDPLDPTVGGAATLIAAWLGALCVVDLRSRRLPTVLLWPGIAATVLGVAAHPEIGAAGLVAAAPYAIARARHLCGGGDVKLAYVLGALTADPRAGILVPVLAAAVALAEFAVRAVVGSVRRDDACPARGRAHAPALVAATVLVLGAV